MVVLLIVLFLLIIFESIYILYYKRQIKEIGEQLAFISKHHSFKFIQTQMKPKEISHLIDSCNVMLRTQREMNQQFIRKNEEMNATIVSLSHDIRTPLTSLDGYLQLATRTESTQEKTHYMKLAQTRTERINKLLDELFLYTRLEHKEYLLELERMDVVNILKRRLFTFFDEFSEKGYEPTIRFPEAPVYIMGDSNAIERVVENIIKNYFVHGEGTMAIHCEEKGNAFIVDFSNEIRDAKSINLDSIFTPFYKGDAARTSHSSGLGLFIVKTLMEKMQGDVSADILQERFHLRLCFQKATKEENHGERAKSTNYINY
ncbi:sensor histidine kinase [Oceanobacillus manasiensis]|uniref:sensor histidine kinase n=1 Tax=Oceanobacillus manasiensis TaxID=586413 RepID=UPI0005AA06B6|nr:HAMP domain-containing sensor histidine kinase [Oceanobacillus manasiensis]